MFGFSWSELGVILVVALIVIGPKDLPIAIRTASAGLRKMRGLAAEFQGHWHELMREADLQDVASELRNLRNFDLGAAVERHIDPEGDLRHAFDPVTDAVNSIGAEVAAHDETHDEHAPEEGTPAEASAISAPSPAPAIELPAFIPPEAADHRQVPAFIPPGTRIW